MSLSPSAGSRSRHLNLLHTPCLPTQMLERLSELRARVANVEANLGEAHSILHVASTQPSPYDTDPGVLLAQAQQAAAAAEATSVVHDQQQRMMQEQIELLKQAHAEMERGYQQQLETMAKQMQEQQMKRVSPPSEDRTTSSAPSQTSPQIAHHSDASARADSLPAASPPMQRNATSAAKSAADDGTDDRAVSRRRSSRDRPVPHPTVVQLIATDEVLAAGQHLADPTPKAVVAVVEKETTASAPLLSIAGEAHTATTVAADRQSPPPPPPSADLPRRPSERIFVGKDGARQVSSPASSTPAPSTPGAGSPAPPLDIASIRTPKRACDSPVSLHEGGVASHPAVISPMPLSSSKLALAVGTDAPSPADGPAFERTPADGSQGTARFVNALPIGTGAGDASGSKSGEASVVTSSATSSATGITVTQHGEDLRSPRPLSKVICFSANKAVASSQNEQNTGVGIFKM